MAFIVEQFIGDRGIQLSAEEAVRPFSFGTNWQFIRVGMRMAINGITTFTNANGPGLGICTGSEGAYSSTTTDAIWRWGLANTTYTVAGVSPNIYLHQSTNLGQTAFQRTGGATVNFGSDSGVDQSISLNPAGLRSMMFMDFVKGTVGVATLGSIVMWMKTNANVTIDATRGEFLAAMEALTPANMSNFAVSSPTLPTRFNKDWDSVLVNWFRTTPSLCVYEMAVTRFS